jgi:hypothetical protein
VLRFSSSYFPCTDDTQSDHFLKRQDKTRQDKYRWPIYIQSSTNGPWIVNFLSVCYRIYIFKKKLKPCTDDTQSDHSKGDHSYADVVKFGDKHQNKHVGDHSYACTVEESGALH